MNNLFFRLFQEEKKVNRSISACHLTRYELKFNILVQPIVLML